MREPPDRTLAIPDSGPRDRRDAARPIGASPGAECISVTPLEVTRLGDQEELVFGSEDFTFLKYDRWLPEPRQAPDAEGARGYRWVTELCTDRIELAGRTLLRRAFPYSLDLTEHAPLVRAQSVTSQKWHAIVECAANHDPPLDVVRYLQRYRINPFYSDKRLKRASAVLGRPTARFGHLFEARHRKERIAHVKRKAFNWDLPGEHAALCDSTSPRSASALEYRWALLPVFSPYPVARGARLDGDFEAARALLERSRFLKGTYDLAVDGFVRKPSTAFRERDIVRLSEHARAAVEEVLSFAIDCALAGPDANCRSRDASSAPSHHRTCWHGRPLGVLAAWLFTDELYNVQRLRT